MVMGMKLRCYAGKAGSVLVLDTGGAAPERKEWQLLCCRSLTLPVDTLLLGPLGRDSPFRLMVLDTDGLSRSVTVREAEVFGRFLRDEGYWHASPVYIAGEAGVFPVDGQGDGWWAVTAPEGLRLRRLLGL